MRNKTSGRKGSATWCRGAILLYLGSTVRERIGAWLCINPSCFQSRGTLKLCLVSKSCHAKEWMQAAKELVCSWSTSSNACCHQKVAKSESLLTWDQSTANGDNEIHFRNVFLIWMEIWPWIESCPGMLQALLLVPFFKRKPFWLLLFFN